MACEVLHQSRYDSALPNIQFSQGNKIKDDPGNNIMIQSSNGNIILDYQGKTHDGWVARVEFLQETGHIKGQLAKLLIRNDINDLHIELSHPSEVITHASNGSSPYKYVQTL